MDNSIDLSGYHEYVKKICNNLPERSVTVCRRMISWQPVVAVLLAVMCIGTYPTTAMIQKYMARMDSMKAETRDNYVKEANRSGVKQDTYNRKFTQSERKRMKSLQKEYEDGKTFPKSSLMEVTDPSQVMGDKICFLAESSSFYLPDSELTQEELLQLIDYKAKRDYSLSAKRSENTETKHAAEKGDISKSQAKKIASAWMSEIYGQDVKNFTVKVEYNEKEQNKVKSKSYYLDYFNKETEQYYYLDIDIPTGRLKGIQCIYNGEKDNEKSGVKEDQNTYMGIYQKEIVKMFGKLDTGREISSAVCEYNEIGGALEYGTIDYIMKLDDGSACIMRYSMNSNLIYDISFVRSIDDYSYEMGSEGTKHKKMTVR